MMRDDTPRAWTRRRILAGGAALGMTSALSTGGSLIAPRLSWARANIVGKVTRLQGSASVIVAGASSQLSVGAGIPLGGTIETGPGARMIVIFDDASQLTLGAEARLVVDEMVYDFKAQESGAVSQALTSLAGAFQFVSGAAARAKPEAITFRTPVATIGIRGTEFFGGSLAAGMPPGQTHYGFMILDGAISVDTPLGSVTLDDFQEGTFLPDAGGAAPTEPSTWSEEAIEQATAAVAFS